MKKGCIQFIILLSLLMAASPCDAQKKTKHKLYNTYWYEVDYDGVKEAWSKEKKVLIPKSLGCTEIKCDFSTGESFIVKTKDGYAGVYGKEDGKAIIEPGTFVEVKYEYGDKYFTAKTADNRVSLIGKDGRIIFPLGIYTRVRLNSSDKSLIEVSVNRKEGICDTLGNIIIPAKWDFISGPYSNNFESKSPNDRYYTAKDNTAHYILDVKGNPIYVDETNSFSRIGYWSYGGYSFIEVSRDKFEGILDMRGQTVIAPSIYENIMPSIKNGYMFFYVKKNGLTGVCNAKGVEVVPTRYRNLFYSDGFKENPGTGQYNDIGVKLDYKFDVADALSPEDAIVKVGNKYRLADRNGNALTKRLYDQLAYDSSEKLYYGQINGYVTVVEADGKEQSPIGKQIFDEAYSMSDAYAQDKLNLYFLLLNTDPSNLDGYNASAYNNIGVISRNAGDDNKAMTYYQKALALDPSDQTAKNNIKAIKAERRAERMSNIANALGQISEAISNINVPQNTGSYGSYQGSGNSSSASSSSSSKALRHCTNCAGSGDCPKCLGRGRYLGKWDQEFHCCPICNSNCSAPKDKVGKCTRCGGLGKR